MRPYIDVLQYTTSNTFKIYRRNYMNLLYLSYLILQLLTKMRPIIFLGFPVCIGTLLWPLLIICVIVCLMSKKKISFTDWMQNWYKLRVMRYYYMSSLEFISREKVSDMCVIASIAVFWVKSIAPVIIEVSWWDNSPPFPACRQIF